MTNKELRSLVNKSLLLSAETRENILSNLDSLEDEKRIKLEGLLLAAQEKQDGWLEAAFKENPELLKQVKDHFHKATMDSLHEQEEASTKEEANTLQGLEDELNNLFE